MVETIALCPHIAQAMPKGMAYPLGRHISTPEYDGIPLRPRVNLRGETYWVGWSDDNKILVKAHLAGERCPPWSWESCTHCVPLEGR